MRPIVAILGGMAALAVMLFLNIAQGEASITAASMWQAILNPADTSEHQIIRTLRLPRAVMGILAGFALAAAGVLLQTVTRNPLSSAQTLGINSGAFMTVTAAAVFMPAWLSAYPLPIACLGGLGALLLVYAIAGGRASTPIRLTLAGMAVSLAIAAVTGTLQLFYEKETGRLFLWGAGSLQQSNWSGVEFAAPWIAGALVAALLLSKRLDLFELGDQTAQGLGVRIGLVRAASLLAAVLLAAVTVSVVGGIGFIGLIAPHLMRLLGIRKHMPLLLASAIWGAVLLLGADTISRMLRDVYGELPVGAVTAMIGGPWMIWLALRMRRGAGIITKSGDVGGLASTVFRRIPYPLLLLGLGCAGLAVCAAGVSIGTIRFPILEVFAVWLGGGEEISRNIMLQMRMPRMLVAAAAGAALAASGLLLQGIVRNPLADPSLIGVSSGAGVGALSVMILFPGIPISMLPFAAFTGAIISAAAVYAIARRSGLNPALVALVGIAVSAMGAGIIQTLVIKAQLRAGSALAWLAGSTYARTWEQLWPLLIWPLVLLPFAWWLSRKLDVLALSEEVPVGLGVSVVRTRLLAGIIGVALAAAAVAAVGSVGFVGLIAPHAARILVGHNHRRLLPVALLLGALLLMAADLIGRIALSPKEIPSGLVVALLGGPYFIALMRAGMKRG